MFTNGSIEDVLSTKAWDLSFVVDDMLDNYRENLDYLKERRRIVWRNTNDALRGNDMQEYKLCCADSDDLDKMIARYNKAIKDLDALHNAIFDTVDSLCDVDEIYDGNVKNL